VITPSAAKTTSVLLVADDDARGADRLAERLLEGGHVRVTRTTASADIGGRLRADRPHVVLLDLEPDAPAGIERVRALITIAGDVPVVVTGVDDVGLALACITAGAQDCLSRLDETATNLQRAIAYALTRAREIAGVVELRRRNEELEAREQQLRALTARLNYVREAERARIAREVHDELGQLLAGVKMGLRWVGKRVASGPAVSPEAIAARLIDAEKLLDATIASVQRIAVELRPSALDALGLSAAIRDEARRFEGRLGIPVRVHIMGSPIPPAEVTTAMFRIFQELMTNIARHARASTVGVFLEETEEEWILCVEDDGVGIGGDELQRSTSLGLLGACERAGAMGGALTVERGIERGTVATVRVRRVAEGKKGGPCVTS
jgi:signal transduction histidine kinase